MRTDALCTILCLTGATILSAAAVLGESQCQSEGCLWGKLGERTTYQQPYCPAMAPEIPFGPTAQEQEMMKRKLPMRPEDALTVVMSDGCTYRVYYREAVRFQPVAEYQTVFEPMRRVERVPVQQINPYTGIPETVWYDQQIETPYPVLHEKETVRYVPTKVLERVFLPGTPSSDSSFGGADPGSAELRFETDIR
ncbi:MAG: hypothetical protein IKE69_11120 [Thermoguttaceae bacterium]|nr:hypothetical protein [Thermoguttaceae bacterium]